MLELAIILTLLLGMLSWMGRETRKRKAMRSVAVRNSRERLHRTISYCEKISRQCVFPLPHTMRIIILKRVASCWWAMHSFGDRHAQIKAEQCEATIQELHAAIAATATYPLPLDGPDKEAVLQSLYLLNRFLQHEIKTNPPYMQRVVAEVQELEDTFLCARLTQMVTKAERALSLGSMGSARACFESAEKLLRDTPYHSLRITELSVRVESGLTEVKKRLDRDRMFHEEPTGSSDGLDRMFSRGKERWS